MQYDDSSESDQSSSSDEEDLDFLLLDAVFPTKVSLDTPRLNLEDLSDEQCDRMFRYANSLLKLQALFVSYSVLQVLKQKALNGSLASWCL